MIVPLHLLVASLLCAASPARPPPASEEAGTLHTWVGTLLESSDEAELRAAARALDRHLFGQGLRDSLRETGVEREESVARIAAWMLRDHLIRWRSPGEEGLPGELLDFGAPDDHVALLDRLPTAGRSALYSRFGRDPEVRAAVGRAFARVLRGPDREARCEAMREHARDLSPIDPDPGAAQLVPALVRALSDHTVCTHFEGDPTGYLSQGAWEILKRLGARVHIPRAVAESARASARGLRVAGEEDATPLEQHLPPIPPPSGPARRAESGPYEWRRLAAGEGASVALDGDTVAVADRDRIVLDCNGRRRTLVDLATAPSGGSPRFRRFDRVVLDGSRAVFSAITGGEQALYAARLGAPPERLLDASMLKGLPGSPDIPVIDSFDADDGRVAFSTGYTYLLELPPLPLGEGKLPSIERGHVTFESQGSEWRVGHWSKGVASDVATLTNQSSSSPPRWTNGAVYYLDTSATRRDGRPLLGVEGGTTRRIAETNGAFAARDGVLAWISAAGELWVDGERLLAPGDLLGGREVVALARLDSRALSGRSVVVRVGRADGSWEAYLARPKAPKGPRQAPPVGRWAVPAPYRGLPVDDFAPLGFSRDGKLAFHATRALGSGERGYLRIQELETNEILAEAWGPARRGDGPLLATHGIVADPQPAWSTLPLTEAGETLEVAFQQGALELVRRRGEAVRRQALGRPFLPGARGEPWVAGVLKSPHEERLAIVVAYPYAEPCEARPSRIYFEVVGASLR